MKQIEMEESAAGSWPSLWYQIEEAKEILAFDFEKRPKIKSF